MFILRAVHSMAQDYLIANLIPLTLQSPFGMVFAMIIYFVITGIICVNGTRFAKFTLHAKNKHIFSD
jgi:uncharacterized membrane protein